MKMIHERVIRSDDGGKFKDFTLSIPVLWLRTTHRRWLARNASKSLGVCGRTPSATSRTVGTTGVSTGPRPTPRWWGQREDTTQPTLMSASVAKLAHNSRICSAASESMCLEIDQLLYSLQCLRSWNCLRNLEVFAKPVEESEGRLSQVVLSFQFESGSTAKLVPDVTRTLWAVFARRTTTWPWCETTLQKHISLQSPLMWQFQEEEGNLTFAILGFWKSDFNWGLITQTSVDPRQIWGSISRHFIENHRGFPENLSKCSRISGIWIPRICR